jgi:Domain of unknown function (DUF4157)/Family of unknown function (DUF6310)
MQPGRALRTSEPTWLPSRQAPSIRRSSFAPPVQRKLTVGVAGDEHEQEADRVAEHVMRAPLEPGGFAPRPVPAIQRKCAGCEDEEQAQRAPLAVEAPQPDASVHGGLDRVRASGGAPLPAPTLTFMQERFGHDFSRVRVHDGALAAESAAALSARAFTVGHDVVFNRGQYAPFSTDGRKLIAHELTHVVQQRTGASPLIQRSACEPSQESNPPAQYTLKYDKNKNALSNLLPLMSAGRELRGEKRVIEVHGFSSSEEEAWVACSRAVGVRQYLSQLGIHVSLFEHPKTDDGVNAPAENQRVVIRLVSAATSITTTQDNPPPKPDEAAPENRAAPAVHLGPTVDAYGLTVGPEGVPREKWSEESEQRQRRAGNIAAADAIRACRLTGNCSSILTHAEAERFMAKMQQALAIYEAAHPASTPPAKEPSRAGLPAIPPQQSPIEAPPESGVRLKLDLSPKALVEVGVGGGSAAQLAVMIGEVAAPVLAAVYVAVAAYVLVKYIEWMRWIQQMGFVIMTDPFQACITGCHVGGAPPGKEPSLLERFPPGPNPILPWIAGGVAATSPTPGARTGPLPLPQIVPNLRRCPPNDCDPKAIPRMSSGTSESDRHNAVADTITMPNLQGKDICVGGRALDAFSGSDVIWEIKAHDLRMPGYGDPNLVQKTIDEIIADAKAKQKAVEDCGYKFKLYINDPYLADEVRGRNPGFSVESPPKPLVPPKMFGQ